MFSEEKFLKLAGLYNPHMSQIETGEKYFSGDNIEEICEYLINLKYNAYSTPFVDKITKDQGEAKSYIGENLTEALLSEEPFIRIYAEIVYKRIKAIEKVDIQKNNLKWFKKKF